MANGRVAQVAGEIAAEGVSQVALVERLERDHLIFQNISPFWIWVNFGAAAAAGVGSIPIAPGGSYEPGWFGPTDQVRVFAEAPALGAEYTLVEGVGLTDVRLHPQRIDDTGATPGFNSGLSVFNTYVINNDGRVLLYLLNTDAAPAELAIEVDRTEGSLRVSDLHIIVPALNGEVVAGPFNPELFNGAGTPDLRFTITNPAGLRMAVLRT